MLPTVEIAFEGVRHSDLIEGYIRGELESLAMPGLANLRNDCRYRTQSQAFFGRSLPVSSPAYG